MHAARIAAIACQWTGVENQIAELLSAAFGGSKKDAAGAHSISRNWIALAAIRETETIRVRLKIMNATLGAILKDRSSELAEQWANLEGDLKKRAKERNRVVHGNWLLSSERPNDLILEEYDGTYKLYTVGDLDQILDRVVEVWRRCLEFQVALLDAKSAGLNLPGSYSQP